MDTRNVQDRFKGMSESDIMFELSQNYSGFIPIFVNVDGDFNKASGIRNANWFNSAYCIIAGKKKWDPRGAVGAQYYTPVHHYESVELTIETLRGLGWSIIAAEITDDAKPLPSYDWPKRSAVLFGEENLGLSQEVLDMVDDVVYIPGMGSVRSLNVSTTSGIMMYDFYTKRNMNA